jgi:hypothetical protein
MSDDLISDRTIGGRLRAIAPRGGAPYRAGEGDASMAPSWRRSSECCTKPGPNELDSDARPMSQCLLAGSDRMPRASRGRYLHQLRSRRR